MSLISFVHRFCKQTLCQFFKLPGSICNIYVQTCHPLDFYDVLTEINGGFIASRPTSTSFANLWECLLTPARVQHLNVKDRERCVLNIYYLAMSVHKDNKKVFEMFPDSACTILTSVLAVETEVLEHTLLKLEKNIFFEHKMILVIIFTLKHDSEVDMKLSSLRRKMFYFAEIKLPDREICWLDSKANSHELLWKLRLIYFKLVFGEEFSCLPLFSSVKEIREPRMKFSEFAFDPSKKHQTIKLEGEFMHLFLFHPDFEVYQNALEILSLRENTFFADTRFHRYLHHDTNMHQMYDFFCIPGNNSPQSPFNLAINLNFVQRDKNCTAPSILAPNPMPCVKQDLVCYEDVSQVNKKKRRLLNYTTDFLLWLVIQKPSLLKK